MGQRLLREAVFAHPHCHRGGDGVAVVGSADGDRVDVLFGFQHFAEIEVGLGTAKADLAFFQRRFIDIADGHDVAGRASVVGIAFAFAADADAGEIDLFVGRFARRGL